MNKYIKKPIPIEAKQFLLVLQECDPEQCFLDFTILKDDKGFYLTIPTPEGNHRADLGDWIAKGYSSKQGYHYWPIKPDYFAENYTTFITPQKTSPDREKLADILYEISHNEYGDAQNLYDLSLHIDRLKIADAIISNWEDIAK